MANIPCIQKAVDLMGESMSEKDATAMFNRMVERTKLKVAEGMSEFDAAKAVASEVADELKLLKTANKRKTLMNKQAQVRIDQNAKNASVWAKGIQKLLEKVRDTGSAIGNKYASRFFANLEELGVSKTAWRNQKYSRNIFLELEQLNYQALGLPNQVGKTGDEVAQKIAKAYFPLRLEAQAQKNLFGANIEEAPGYVMLQTHDATKLRRAGSPGFFSKESKTTAYKNWRNFIDTLKIDWSKTLAGEDHDAFLGDFFDAIYTQVHGNPIDQATKTKKFNRPGSSLADKLSSQRVLWFKDGESAFAYNEKFGMYGVQEAIMHDLRNSGRNIAMLQYLGANPVDNVQAVRNKLRTETKGVENAQEQANALDSHLIDGQLDLTTGKANISKRPWLSSPVDFLKSWTYATKGGGIILSALTDKAFGQARMTYEGFSQVEKMAGQVAFLAKKNPKFAAELGVFSQSWATSSHGQWTDQVKPMLYMNKLTEWTMRFQGLNAWTYHNQVGMGMALSHRMGVDAKLPFDKLEPRRQQVLKEYGFSPKEWEVIRKTVVDNGEGEPLVFASGVNSTADDLIDTLIDGPKTPASRNRTRALLESKLDYYIQDAINEGVPLPGAAVQSIKTLNGTQRGAWSRELAELFFVFKGFPIKASMIMARQGKGIGGLSGAQHVFWLIAQAGALGYLSQVAKDAVKGRTPKKLIDENGMPNGMVWFESLARGGGLGIYGDFLYSSYDRRYKSWVEASMGPVYGQAFQGVDLARKGFDAATGIQADEKLGYNAFKQLEANLPLINMFPVKQTMDHLIMWQLKEALSPGVFQRQKQSIEDHNYQEYFFTPVGQ